MTDTLVRTLLATAGRCPGRRALKQDDVELAYEALENQSARAAGLLRRHGVEPGDRVGIMLPNVPQFAFVYYGLLRAGCTVVPDV